MDWTGEHLIRSAHGSNARRLSRRNAQSICARKRVPDGAYIAAASAGMTVKAAAKSIGVSAVSIWKASKRLGIAFQDGRKHG